MAELIADTMDWSVYERATEAKVKVQPASKFVEDLVAEFAPKGAAKSAMVSTKLSSKIDFRPGEVTVWAGYNGHRKSMFAGQVALDMCVQNQRTLICSMEMYPRATLARMARQAFLKNELGRSHADFFGKWTDGRLWLFDHHGRVKPSVLLAVMRYFADEFKGAHIFIDSMMMVCESEESLDEQKQFMTDLVRSAQETSLHVHLIAHCRKPQTGEDRPPTKYDVKGTSAISDQAHNVITVYANKAKKTALERNPHDQQALADPDQFITVEKQRNGEWEGRAGLWFHELGLRFSDEQYHAAPYAFTRDMH